jgi:hypothetical protein
MQKDASRHENHVSMQKQKQVLLLREELLAQVSNPTPPVIEKINLKMFEQLRKVSPAGLTPILIRRNNGEWIAAYLVQEVGLGGSRILLKHKSWELVFARQSAQIVKIDQFHDLFESIVNCQREFFAHVDALLTKIRKRKQKVILNN